MLTLVVGDCRPGYAGDGGPAANAQLFFAVDVAGMATDGSGNLFITDRFNYRIRKVTASGVITTVAGNGLSGFTGDGGPAISAQIENPRAVAVDTAGNLYIASQGHIRKVTTGGVITTLAAEGGEGIALDGQGNVYFSSQNYTIRKISANGSITTVAGTGTNGFSGDGGPAASAQISTVYGIAFDSAGSLYVSDNYNYRIRKISADGVITTVAGVGINGHSGDGGLATSAQISFSDGVSVDSGGNLLILDNGFVRRVSSTSGIITTVAGSSTATYPNGDGGPAISGRLASPLGVAVDSQGNLYIPESNRVRIVSNTGIITTFAGTGAFGFSGDGGPASKAQLANPNSVVVDSGGNLYITDAGNHRIRKVSRDGTITTVAGNGTIGSSGDGGPAISAQLNSPCALALDNAGNLYITDQNDNRIRKVTASGVIATLAGVGLAGYSGDNGPAASAQLSNPLGIALDTIGNLYIADRGNNRIRKVDTSGTITTVAGNGSVTFVLTDGGLATNASLNQPTGVAIDSAGNLFIADNYSRIRKVSPSGIIVTVAGIGGASGNVGYTGDGGPAVNAQLRPPTGWRWGRTAAFMLLILATMPFAFCSNLDPCRCPPSRTEPAT
jgi:sugar lactone lactonase YvrE